MFGCHWSGCIMVLGSPASCDADTRFIGSSRQSGTVAAIANT